MLDMTDMPKLTMTPTERLMGRFMRAPDGHDAGGADAGGDTGDAANSDGATSTDAGGAGEGDGNDGGDDVTLLGGAKKADGAGADDDGKGGEGENGDGDDQGDAGDTPEAYELTMPEGVTMDADLMSEATPLLKEAGLSNEAANKLVPLVGKIQTKVAEAMQKQTADNFAAMKTDWANEAKADEEIGGAKLDETTHFAAVAFDKFGVPAGSPLRTLLDETGLGNHPEMLRFVSRVGRAVGEDNSFERGDVPAKPVSREEARYGSKEKEK